jgi:hypothetical protein
MRHQAMPWTPAAQLANRYFFARFLGGVGTVPSGYNARMIPILGCMVSPPGSATSISAWIAASHAGDIVLALRQASDVVASIAQSAQLTAAGQGDGVVEGAVPTFVRHQ